MKELTQEYLKQCLDYDPETGIFTWKERPENHFIDKKTCNQMNAKLSGKKAGCYDKNGYVYIRINRKNYFAHRLVWLYLFGVWPKIHIDHINMKVYDNRVCNLREANSSTNRQNIKNPNKDSKSGILGVTKRNSNRFESQIGINGKNIYLGSFKTKEEAQAAYLKAKRELHPFSTL